MIVVSNIIQLARSIPTGLCRGPDKFGVRGQVSLT